MLSDINQLLEFQTIAFGYVYTREFITQPIPISHFPGKFKFWIWQLYFFSNSCFWWCYQTYVSEYN